MQKSINASNSDIVKCHCFGDNSLSLIKYCSSIRLFLFLNNFLKGYMTLPAIIVFQVTQGNCPSGDEPKIPAVIYLFIYHYQLFVLSQFLQSITKTVKFYASQCSYVMNKKHFPTSKDFFFFFGKTHLKRQKKSKPSQVSCDKFSL